MSSLQIVLSADHMNGSNTAKSAYNNKFCTKGRCFLWYSSINSGLVMLSLYVESIVNQSTGGRVQRYWSRWSHAISVTA